MTSRHANRDGVGCYEAEQLVRITELSLLGCMLLDKPYSQQHYLGCGGLSRVRKHEYLVERFWAIDAVAVNASPYRQHLAVVQGKLLQIGVWRELHAEELASEGQLARHIGGPSKFQRPAAQPAAVAARCAVGGVDHSWRGELARDHLGGGVREGPAQVESRLEDAEKVLVQAIIICENAREALPQIVGWNVRPPLFALLESRWTVCPRVIQLDVDCEKVSERFHEVVSRLAGPVAWTESYPEYR